MEEIYDREDVGGGTVWSGVLVVTDVGVAMDWCDDVGFAAAAAAAAAVACACACAAVVDVVVVEEEGAAAPVDADSAAPVVETGAALRKKAAAPGVAMPPAASTFSNLSICWSRTLSCHFCSLLVSCTGKPKILGR